jgi:hypothetical protein
MSTSWKKIIRKHEIQKAVHRKQIIIYRKQEILHRRLQLIPESMAMP